MSTYDRFLDRLGDWIARRLEHRASGYEPFTPSAPDTLRRILWPGDVILVDGVEKISTAIKYLTQSTWSHAALYVGDMLGQRDEHGEPLDLVEVVLGQGCIAVPLSKYSTYNTRICRPAGLRETERRQVARFMIDHIGTKYDTRNIVDLARYLFPTPPVPVRWRRRMIALGSGEPTRAICSSLIARAFQSVKYPVLPRIERLKIKPGTREQRRAAAAYRREILHIRHHSLFMPRDFDLSPYFAIIKPSIMNGFDPHKILWGDDLPDEGGPDEDELDKTQGVAQGE